MSDGPKVHVFLGAPPPPAGLEEGTVSGEKGEERHPAGWRHLELRWKQGRLGAEPGEAFRDQIDTWDVFKLSLDSF